MDFEEIPSGNMMEIAYGNMMEIPWKYGGKQEVESRCPILLDKILELVKNNIFEQPSEKTCRHPFRIGVTGKFSKAPCVLFPRVLAQIQTQIQAFPTGQL